MEIGTQGNIIPRNANLSCYNTVDKATSVMSKNIELDIINYVPLYQIQVIIPKHQEKFRQVIKLKIMQNLNHGRHCDHKALKRAIPDLNYVPLK